MKFRIRRPWPPAFTLVETVLAIGILAVALLGISSALVTAQSSSIDNDRDTLMVSMSERILTGLRLVPFDALGSAEPQSSSIPAPQLTVSSKPEDSVYYFDADGQPVPADRRLTEAVYRCTLKKKPIETGLTPAGPGMRCELLQLTLVFQTPASAPENVITTRTLSTRLARRQGMF